MGKKGLQKQILVFMVFISGFSVLFNSCQPKEVILKSPPEYDFSKMEITNLPEELDEISGIAWDPNKNVFAAVKDELGRVYILDKGNYKIQEQYNFVGKGDFEDIAYVNSVPYIMESDGTLYKCSIDSVNSIATKLGKLEVKGKVDFESLYYDITRNSLILLCKNCDIDDNKKVSAYAYNLDSNGFNSTPVYQIDVKAVKKLSEPNTPRLEPSAAAVHPIQKKLYILSAGSKQLLRADLNGNVENVYVLAGKFFPQAEGLCFKKNGEMFITNEGGTGRASLLKMPFFRRSGSTSTTDTSNNSTDSNSVK